MKKYNFLCGNTQKEKRRVGKRVIALLCAGLLAALLLAACVRTTGPESAAESGAQGLSGALEQSAAPLPEQASGQGEDAAANPEGARVVYEPFAENGLWGYKNNSGEIVVPARYEKAGKLENGVGTLQNGGLYGYFLESGFLLEPQYEILEPFVGESALVCKGERWGMISKAGEVLIPLEYARAERWSENEIHMTTNPYFEAVLPGQRAGVFDARGNPLVEPDYDWVIALSTDGYHRASRDGKCGLLDEDYNVVIPLEYDSIGDGFDSGLTAVSKNGKYGFVNRENEAVIPLAYAAVSSFQNGVAIVYPLYLPLYRTAGFENGFEPDLTVAEYHVIDAKGNTLYAAPGLLLWGQETPDPLSDLLRESGGYPVFKFGGEVETLDINGYYYQADTAQGEWRQYQNEPAYSVFQLAELEREIVAAR